MRNTNPHAPDTEALLARLLQELEATTSEIRALLRAATRRIADLEEMVDSTCARNLKVTAELATAREAALEEAALACEKMAGLFEQSYTRFTSLAENRAKQAMRDCAFVIRALKAQAKA